MKSFKKILPAITLLAGLLVANQALAQSASSELLPPCTTSGNCTVCDMMQVGINAAVIVMGLIGAITFMVFIYGGFVLLTSAGRSGEVTKGKNILINASIGLVIVLCAYFVVSTVVAVIAGNFNWQNKLNCPSSGTSGSGNTSGSGSKENCFNACVAGQVCDSNTGNCVND